MSYDGREDEARAQARGMELVEYRLWRELLRRDYHATFPRSPGRAIVTALPFWSAEER